MCIALGIASFDYESIYCLPLLITQAIEIIFFIQSTVIQFIYTLNGAVLREHYALFGLSWICIRLGAARHKHGTDQ